MVYRQQSMSNYWHVNKLTSCMVATGDDYNVSKVASQMSGQPDN